MEAEATISAYVEMVVFCFPETLQFPDMKKDSIPELPQKLCRTERLKSPEFAPDHYRRKENAYAENVEENETGR